MKTRNLNRLVALGVLATSLTVGAMPPPPSDIQLPDDAPVEMYYMAPLNAENTENDYKQLTIPKEIYPYIQEDYANFRIYDLNTDEEIPYSVVDWETSITMSRKDYTLVPKGDFIEEDTRYFDFEVEVTDTLTDVLLSSLTFDITHSPAAKDIVLLGSHDGTTWEEVTESTLYYIDEETLVNTVQFNDALKYTHYRVGVLNHAGEMAVRGCSGAYVQEDIVRKKHTEVIEPSYTVEDSEDKETVYRIDNTYNLNIASLSASFGGNYDRPFRIELYDQEDTLVDSFNGSILNLQTGTVVRQKDRLLTNVFTDFAYAKLIIQDGDDRPLENPVFELSYYEDQLIYQAKDETCFAKFYYDAPGVADYDLNAFADIIIQEPMDTATFGDAPNFKYLVGEVAEEEPSYRFIYWGALSVTAVIMVAFIFREMKRS